MRGVLVTAVVCSALAVAQAIVDPSRLARFVNRLDAKPTDKLVNCSVEPVKPLLGFGFRFRAGYVFHVEMDRASTPGRRWTVLSEITPEATGQPVYLVDVLTVPAAPKNKITGEAGGGYLLGEGRYKTRWMLIDDSGSVCRKSWDIEVKLHHGETSARVAMPPNRVAELSLRGLRAEDRHPDEGRPVRLTLLVDAAPLYQRRLIRNSLSTNDHGFLVSAVSAILERIPTSTVRLVVFNLEQQRELFRRDEFGLESMGEMSRALNNLRLATVNYRILQKPRGHVEFLAGLINQEIRTSPAQDAVIFLGPRERFDDKVPPELLDPVHDPASHFFFLRYRPAPSVRSMMAPDPCDQLPHADTRAADAPMAARHANTCGTAPMASTPTGDGTFSSDTVSLAVKTLKGRTISIQSPSEFARAIEQVERRVGITDAAHERALAQR